MTPLWRRRSHPKPSMRDVVGEFGNVGYWGRHSNALTGSSGSHAVFRGTNTAPAATSFEGRLLHSAARTH